MLFIVGLLVFPALIGFFFIYHVVRPQKLPADESNRINKIILVWFALSREGDFVKMYPWLKKDLKENFKDGV